MATSKIAEVINQIQEDTQSVINVMETNLTHFQDEVHNMNENNETLELILKSVKNTEQYVNKV